VRLILQWLAVLVLLWPAEALGAVRIDFHSRDYDRRFPHAFVVLTGTVDATGEAVDASYGFTPIGQISPAILAGPAEGHVNPITAADIAKANLHFSIVLTDEEYARVMARVAEWKALPQPSYRLRERNCITFVADIAAVLGLDAAMVKGLEWKPHGFLDSVRDRNARAILARGGEVFAVSRGARRAVTAQASPVVASDSATR